jgi:anti-anti-sigma factor
VSITEPEEKLEYFLSEKQQFLVVSLVGSLTKSTQAEIQKCEDAILASAAKYIVLNFHDLKEMDLTGIRPLVQLQKRIREKPAQMRLCFVKTEIFNILDGAAAIRPQELCGDLVQALKSFDIAPSKP